MNIDLERLLIEKFVKKEKKNRYLTFIEKEKTRKKFLSELYHFKDFNWKLFEEIPGNQKEVGVILKKLNDKKNISDCYIISVNENFDGKTFSIQDAIKKLEGIEGTIKIFGDAEVIYYEGESPSNRYISK
jgi:hypothetical protein